MNNTETEDTSFRPCFSCDLQPWQFHLANVLFLLSMAAPSQTRYGQVVLHSGLAFACLFLLSWSWHVRYYAK